MRRADNQFWISAYLAAGANQNIYLAYPSRSGPTRTVNFLSGGSFAPR